MAGRHIAQPTTGTPQEVDESVMAVYADPNAVVYNPNVPPPPIFKVPHALDTAPQVPLQTVIAPSTPAFGPHMAAAPTPVPPQFHPPTTMPGQLMSHSEGYVQSPVRMPLMPQQSLPSLSGSTKRIIMPDEIGIDKTYFIDDVTMQNVRALIHEAEMRKQQAVTGVMYEQPKQLSLGYGTQMSMGSLPSAGSLHSSASSLGSNISQPPAYYPMMQNVDPAAAIKEHYQTLIQMGRTHEVNQLATEMGLSLQGQPHQVPYQAGHVHFAGGEVSHFEVQNLSRPNTNDVSAMGNGCNNVQLEDSHSTDYPRIRETSSVENNLLKGKPKKGVLQKVNTVLSRLFYSKL